jgi:hypothetical protein
MQLVNKSYAANTSLKSALEPMLGLLGRSSKLIALRYGRDLCPSLRPPGVAKSFVLIRRDDVLHLE